MKICAGRFLACWLIYALASFLELSAAQFTAKWIGPIDGNWDSPTNWDIGRVPQNTGPDTYDVIWDSHSVVVTLTQDVTVRNFTFASGGVVKAPNASFRLTVAGDFQWSSGVLAVGGRTSVEGSATLHGVAGDSLKLQGGFLWLKGQSALFSTLQCLQDAVVVNDVGATLNVLDGAGFTADTTNPRIENQGTFRVQRGDQAFPCIYFINRGMVTMEERTVEFQTHQLFDFNEQDGKLTLEGTVLKGIVFIDRGSLAGRGYIREVIALGGISGQLSFDKLSLGNSATSTFDVGDNTSGGTGRFSADHDVMLGGNIVVNPAGGIRPTDVFEILTATGGIFGEFGNIPFGQRVPVAGGVGSLVLERRLDQKSVVLRDFVSGPFSLGAGALAFQLPQIGAGSGGAFVAPAALINLPDGNWDGGTVKVEIMTGFDATLDELEIRENPALPADELTMTGTDAGDRVVSFRGTPFGTVQIANGRLTCALNSNARNQAIAALLGRLFYRNSQLTPDWFVQPGLRYPERTFQFTLVDGDGGSNQLTQSVPFPHLTGIGFSDPVHYVPTKHGYGEGTLFLKGIFSNAQRLSVRYLETDWATDCDNMSFVATSFPGQKPFTINGIEPGCSVTAKSGLFEASVAILPENCVVVVLSRIFGLRGAASKARLQQAPGPGSLSLANFYALQLLMSETPAGRRLVDLYWEHSAEVIQVLSTNLTLRDEAFSLLRTFQPGVVGLLSARGSEVTITQAMIDQLNRFWTALADLSSPPLRTDLLSERERFNGFQPFVNKGFGQWAALLEFPAPLNPRIQLSSATRADGSFRVEANDVGGDAPSLWRAIQLPAWEEVPNAVLERSDFSLFFTDPAPPGERAFYQLRP